MPWVKKSDILGGLMFVVGVALLVGWFFTDKVHGVEKFVIVVAFVLMILGAHFVSSEPTEKALKAIAGTAKDVLPFAIKKKDDEPPPGGP